MTTTLIEHRTASGDVALEPESRIASGYAAVFGRRSLDLGGFTEMIDPDAFTRTVQQADVVALWDHDERHLLGRVASGTLRLSIDARGLAYELDLPDTSTGRDLAELLRRGDVRGSSFGFRTVRDEWHQDDDGAVTRTLLEVALIDVSPVARPAYPDTDAALRDIAGALGHELAEVRGAIEARRLGDLISPQGGDVEGDSTERPAPPPFRPPLTHLYA